MFKTHNSRGFLICFVMTVLVLALYTVGAFDVLELKAVDARFQFRGNRPVHPDLAVIVIDDPSIEKLGRWPWARATHAQMVQILKGAGAKAIGFDTLFTEKDLSNPQSDLALAQAAEETELVVSAFFFQDGFRDRIYGQKARMPYEPLVKNSYFGFVNLDPDHDGVTRRANMYAIENEAVYPSLAVATLALSQGKSFEQALETLPVVVNPDPLLAENEIFINYAFDRASPTGYPYPVYSYADVLLGKTNSSVFKDKIVFVGATAAALFDMKAIPFISKHAGVMVHVNIVDNLLSGNYLREVPTYYTALCVLLIGLFLGYLLPRLSPWAKISAFFLIVGGEIAFSFFLFTTRNIVFPVVPPMLLGISCYGGVLFYKLLIEEREKRKIKGSFRQYLSPKIIDILTKDPSKLRLGGEEREVSIFFLDIAGFTTMSEALKPSQLVEVMNSCLTEFSNIILKHDGLINKYIGDCIMAFWNAPADQPDHAAMACRAALDCIKVLPEINKRFQEKGLPAIDCRVGINTGVVVVGNMGSNEKFDYTVMGDPVNLASRLEGANKQYHTRIMVSDVTFEKARDHIEARDLDLIRVKGKKEPRKVFEVLCRKGEMTVEMIEGRKLYHQGLSLYRQRSFEEAIESFQSVFNHLPNDHVSRVYMERARTFKLHAPPPQWDGVYEMTTK